MQSLKKIFFFSVIFSPLWAAAASPQPGMWGVNSEFNGEPGRGVQIDRQGGNKVIATYFGYKPTGEAIFYQAVGLIDADSTFAADLVEYKNGTVIGGSPRAGEFSSNVGQVIMTFSSPLEGTIKLPGEVEKKISPLIYEDKRSEANSTYRGLLIGKNGQAIFNLRFTQVDEDIQIELGKEGYSCKYRGHLNVNGLLLNASTEGGCVGPSINLFNKKFDDIKINEDGTISLKIDDVIQSPSSGRDISNGTFIGKCIMPIESITDTGSTIIPCK